MQTGTLVRTKLFYLKFKGEDIYRYGIVLPQPEEFDERFTKVMWQPSKDIPFGKGRNQTEIILTEKLEIVKCMQGI